MAVGKMSSKRIALIGAKGMLARMMIQHAPSDYELCLLDLPDFDLTDNNQVVGTISRLSPSVIINCAAFTNVDACETQEEFATRVNGAGVGFLARAAKHAGAVLVQISTDYVFDGTKTEPYSEEDVPNPRSAYGRSKLAGERAVLESGLEQYFIIRTSWLYGPCGRNFVETILRRAQEREELRVVADQVGTPTYTVDLAQAIFSLLALASTNPSRLLPHELYGTYHFSNEGQCSWHEFACAIVQKFVEDGGLVKIKSILPISTEEYPLPATRPAYSVFSKNKYLGATGAPVPSWQESLQAYFTVRQSDNQEKS
jgi:dTDP-4-dehydrorhamnose reductase